MASSSSVGRLRMRHPVLGAGGGGLYVSEFQRRRLLDAAVAVVSEQGYRGMAVRSVTERAGVSSKTFYDLFTDREDCFLAAFDHAVEEITAAAAPAYEREGDWVAGVRGGLGAVLSFLDSEPELCRLVIVEALGAGPRVLQRRAGVLKGIESVVDEGRAGMGAGELPPLLAEGITSATFGVIHARLLEDSHGPLIGLLSGLMATIVLPYRGRAAAAQELKRPVQVIGHFGKAGPVFDTIDKPAHLPGRGTRSGRSGRTSGPRAGSGRTSGSHTRLTVRGYAVLAGLEEHAGVSNREVSELVGVADQGQISRLMMRLADQALVHNTGGEAQGQAKAWHLTPQGEEALHASRPRNAQDNTSMSTRERERSTPKATPRPRARRGKSILARGSFSAPVDFRLTARTHLVLTAVNDLDGQKSDDERGPSNRQVADAAGVQDEGQISKLLARLEGLGLLQNTGGRTKGHPNAWSLTPRGEDILHVGSAASRQSFYVLSTSTEERAS